MIVRATLIILLLTAVFGFRILDRIDPGTWSQLPQVSRLKLIQRATAGDKEAQYKLASAYQARAQHNHYPNKKWWERELASRDYLQALTWFRKSATAGYLPAINQMGIHYLEGWGEQVDLDHAAIWLQKAVEKHFVPAMVNLAKVQLMRAQIISHQRYFEDYYRSAYLLLSQAAQEGEAAGQFWLGKMYAQGIQVAKNNEQARYWWSIAAAQDFQPAVIALAGLEPRNPPDQNPPE